MEIIEHLKYQVEQMAQRCAAACRRRTRNRLNLLAAGLMAAVLAAPAQAQAQAMPSAPIQQRGSDQSELLPGYVLGASVAPAQGDGTLWPPSAHTGGIEAAASDAALAPVALTVWEHRFRIPHAYFRYPPSRSGVDRAFYIRALWPGIEPETEANRAAFRASIRTEAGQRVLAILLESTQPGMPWPVARWMFENHVHSPSRSEAGRMSLEDFSPPTSATFGLRALAGQLNPKTRSIDEDLFYGMLPDGRFVGMYCGRDPRPERMTTCRLWFDWRPGT
jgi:hypothetical protein